MRVWLGGLVVGVVALLGACAGGGAGRGQVVSPTTPTTSSTTTTGSVQTTTTQTPATTTTTRDTPHTTRTTTYRSPATPKRYTAPHRPPTRRR